MGNLHAIHMLTVSIRPLKVPVPFMSARLLRKWDMSGEVWFHQLPNNLTCTPRLYATHRRASSMRDQ